MKMLLSGIVSALLFAGCCSRVDCAAIPPPLTIGNRFRLENFSSSPGDSVLIQAYSLTDSVKHFEATVPVTIDSFSKDTVIRFPESHQTTFEEAYVLTYLSTGKRYRVDGYKFVKVAYGCSGCGMNQAGSYVDELSTYEVNGQTVTPQASAGYGTNFYLRYEW